MQLLRGSLWSGEEDGEGGIREMGLEEVVHLLGVTGLMPRRRSLYPMWTMISPTSGLRCRRGMSFRRSSHLAPERLMPLVRGGEKAGSMRRK